jgi:hypothetical protein
MKLPEHITVRKSFNLGAVDIETASVIKVLKEHGLHVVDEAQMRVLVCASRETIYPACSRGVHCCAKFDDGRDTVEAELRRRDAENGVNVKFERGHK